MVKLEAKDFKKLRISVLGLSVYLLLDIVMFFIFMNYKRKDSFVDNLTLIYLFPAAFLLIIFTFIKFNSRKEKLISLQLINIWGYSLILSKSVNVLFSYLFRDNIKLVNQFSVFCLVASIVFSLFMTGIVLNNIYFKVSSLIFILIQFLIALLPNIEFITYNDLLLVFYMYPIYLKAILAIVCMYFYYLINSHEKQKNISAVIE